MSEGVDWQHVGNLAWVVPEEPDRSLFLKYTAVSR